MDFTTVKTNLEKHRYAVSVFPDVEAASAYLEAAIKDELVGFGGSETLEKMGLYERLGKNNTMVWHWVNPDDRARNPECGVYLCSVNALAETGEMVNIDGTGNRIAATLFGPKKVYFVIGRNKIRPDLQSAVARARQVAGPLDAIRLKRKTPCVTDGKCRDCASPERICGVLAVYMRPMLGAEHTEVVLVDADLGM